MRIKQFLHLLVMYLLPWAGLSIIHTNPDARISLNRRRRVSAHTANYVITAGESGTFFTSEGAAGEIVFTLPALKTGFECEIFVAELQNVVLSSPDADTIVVFNDVAADQIAFNTANEQAGGLFHVVCDGTKWMVSENIHDGQTAVIAT